MYTPPFCDTVMVYGMVATTDHNGFNAPAGRFRRHLHNRVVPRRFSWPLSYGRDGPCIGHSSARPETPGDFHAYEVHPSLAGRSGMGGMIHTGTAETATVSSPNREVQSVERHTADFQAHLRGRMKGRATRARSLTRSPGQGMHISARRCRDAKPPEWVPRLLQPCTWRSRPRFPVKA